MNKISLSALTLLCAISLTACDKLPNSIATKATPPVETPATPAVEASATPDVDDATTPASNTETSNWKGMSSDGSTSLVSQVSTGDNTFSFTETWTLSDGSTVETEGTGVYDEASKTNVYTYTKPTAAVVKVSTEEKDDGNTSIDTVLESNSDLFSVDEQITYSKQP